MTTPIAAEISRRLEPVAPDPFIDHLPASALEPGARPHAGSAATTARPRA
jgi:hypothetical protein